MMTFDYETEGIVGNPIVNPPRPVGVSIKFDDGPSRYYAWGHPTENNCSFEEGSAALITALACDKTWLAHNAPFELAVTNKWIVPLQFDPVNFHDTQYLLFLINPYASTFSLKPSAERILGIPPTEQDELQEWILAHVPGATKKTWGAYISCAPGNLVGKYAGDSQRTGVPGDTDRTYLLYQKLRPQIEQHGMWAAYQREQKLMPIMFRSSQHGIRIDRARLEEDTERYGKILAKCDDMIRAELGAPNLSVDSDAQLVEALTNAGAVTKWILTPKGAPSVSRANLSRVLKDPGLFKLLDYRGTLVTILGTFAGPWLEFSRGDNRLHTQWNQVRGDRTTRDVAGTRTGRLSSMEPNFQNVIVEYPAPPDPGFLSLMDMRSYMLPEEGHVWLKRDFSAQEMRIMAHFAEGKLYEAFRRDPKTDPHKEVQQIIHDVAGLDLERKHVKITGFGIMYGRGAENLGYALDLDHAAAVQLRNAYYFALPEVRKLADNCKRRGQTGGAVRTWGGRLYYREPSEARDMSYKLLNYLIQGSAADQTKESIIDWEEIREPDDTFLATVHDENNISAPEEDAAPAMIRLRESMDRDRFDVPFMSEGFVGKTWGGIQAYDPLFQ